jgi:hypothetical protein
MLLAWRDLDPFPCLKHEVMTLNFQGQLTFQDEEELPGMDVGVADLTCTGRHELLDNAEFWRFNKVPAVAVISVRAAPLVMFSRLSAYDSCRHEDYRQE